jgi:hypothetical protein
MNDPDEEEHQRLGFRRVEWDELDSLVERIDAMLDMEVKEGEPYRRIGEIPSEADVERRQQIRRYLGERVQGSGHLPESEQEITELLGEVSDFLKRMKE